MKQRFVLVRACCWTCSELKIAKFSTEPTSSAASLHSGSPVLSAANDRELPSNTMHSHLIPHKHPGCLDVMLALEECHAKGFIHKALGQCNDAKRQVNACFAEERKAKAKVHRDIAMEKRRKTEASWKEIDANS